MKFQGPPFCLYASPPLLHMSVIDVSNFFSQHILKKINIQNFIIENNKLKVRLLISYTK